MYSRQKKSKKQNDETTEAIVTEVYENPINDEVQEEPRNIESSEGSTENEEELQNDPY